MTFGDEKWKNRKKLKEVQFIARYVKICTTVLGFIWKDKNRTV